MDLDFNYPNYNWNNPLLRSDRKRQRRFFNLRRKFNPNTAPTTRLTPLSSRKQIMRAEFLPSIQQIAQQKSPYQKLREIELTGQDRVRFSL